MTHRDVMLRMVVGGLLALILAGSQGAAWADWKTRAAVKTVGHAAKAGLEHAGQDSGLDAALGEGQPGRSGPDVIGQPKRDDRIGSAAGEGLEGAMRAGDLASDMAHAVRTVNRARKVIR